jgi:branched-chain amino acid transport system substrate-binding protein
VNRKFVAKTNEMFNYTPDKFMAVGAFALEVWVMAANELKTLGKEPLAKRIRGGSFMNTIFGDATSEPNGQLKSRIYTFSVQDQKIVVDLD